MRYYTFPVAGQPITVGRGGPTLHVINHPYLDYGQAAFVNPALGGVNILVGFDRTPTEDDHEFVIPALSDVLLAVPSSVQVVNLLYATGIGPSSSSPIGAQRIAVEWLDCVVATGVRFPVTSGRIPDPLAPAILQDSVDNTGGHWQPQIVHPLLDQAWLPARVGMHTRPKIPPSVVDTAHVVTAANTLVDWSTISGQDFLDPSPATVLGWQVVHRIIVSMSAAGLFVIGANGLTVGAPGADELGRLAFPAAGVQVLDYGEGLEVDVYSLAGPWKLYTSVIATLDITVIGG